MNGANRLLQALYIFMRAGREWWTPPVACGLLAGVMREQTIRRLRARERAFTVAKLRSAAEIRVTNAVQGVLRARLAAKS